MGMLLLAKASSLAFTSIRFADGVLPPFVTFVPVVHFDVELTSKIINYGNILQLCLGFNLFKHVFN